jgi:hypothetical protein
MNTILEGNAGGFWNSGDESRPGACEIVVREARFNDPGSSQYFWRCD